MKFKARLKEAIRDISGGGYKIVFLTENLPNSINDLADKDLFVKAAVYRKRRSLNANAYFHLLNGKLADKLGISKARCKNTLIGRYGQYMMIDGEPAVLKTNVPPEKMLENETFHSSPFAQKKENNKNLVYYYIYRGTHSYDTKEMGILINGTVEECKEQGIDTVPPDELKAMMAAWENSGEYKKWTV